MNRLDDHLAHERVERAKRERESGEGKSRRVEACLAHIRRLEEDLKPELESFVRRMQGRRHNGSEKDHNRLFGLRAWPLWGNGEGIAVDTERRLRWFVIAAKVSEGVASFQLREDAISDWGPAVETLDVSADQLIAKMAEIVRDHGG